MESLQQKSMKFAIRIVNLYKHLCDEKKEYVMSKQLLRSATSIGANLAEAVHAQSNDDFIHKINISLKEASESKFWIELLFQTDYLTKNAYQSLMHDCAELNKLLAASLLKLKSKSKL